MAKSSDGLKKLAPGKWLARITARDPATGKKTIDTDRTIYADTKLEALAKRKALRDELIGSGSEWTVDEALDAWIPTLRAGTLHTRKTHARRIRERFGRYKLSLVPPTEVQRWLAELAGCDDTANYHRATLQALYKFARKEGKLQGANPLERTVPRHTPKTSAQLLAELEAPPARRALLGDEVARFFSALQQHDPHLYPVAKLQLLLGCRWAEVTALQWHDVDLQTGVVVVRRSQSRNGELGPPKGKKARISALGPQGVAFLVEHREAMARAQWPGWELYVFPRPSSEITGKPRPSDMWGYETTRRRIHDVLDALGIDLASATHTFRHTNITIAASQQNDAVLRAMVGHSSPQMTQAYTDPSIARESATTFAGGLETKLAGGVFGGVDSSELLEIRKKTR